MRDKNLNLIVDMARHGQVENLFPTPLFWYVLKSAEALNTRLRELILERERTIPSAAKSNQGGWQSPPDFFDWGEPAVTTLERCARGAVKIATARLSIPPGPGIEFRLYGWAAVNRKGHYNTMHVHPMATWSGVYYVDPGDEAPDTPGALLEFSHPITASVMTFFPGVLPSARILRPVAGMLILFPSYLQHSVRLYHGERPRICVAFNAHLNSAGG